MQVTKTMKPMKPNLPSLFFVSASVFLSACEDFVRFRTEKYTCDINRLGERATEQGLKPLRLPCGKIGWS